MIKNYFAKIKDESSNDLSICLYVKQDKIAGIGQKLNGRNSDAYMSGYNWNVFLNYYLDKNHPDILQDMKADPRDGMYIVHFPLMPNGEKKASQLIEIITDLVENESKISQIATNKCLNSN
ncbi:Imm51 family immunity protein [Dysgonomonas sp. 520]|uniref:Imm51 family immunity protein n=1 Tax=Dysgonomonas sp. 520 TaxID=2302931 RepID=UPI0013D351C2|nr:Imm51 family immunity protein [Dysgonomonas sp. 520]NDW08211.1 hypothetical protein [Dysgonomonas sp. 520]